MIKLKNVSKIHRAGEIQTTALNQIDLEIEAGEYVAITGPSGCGKSTLLNLLGLLDQPSSGQLWFDGQRVDNLHEAALSRLRAGKVGFIFQSFNLIQELSVYENIALALEYTDMPARAQRSRIQALLSQLEVQHRSGHRPSQLSGGQQQRVAIARALAASPTLLLADEPTGNLDSAHGDDVMRILRDINAQGTTVVMVTHSAAHAAQASRTLRLFDGRVLVDARDAVTATTPAATFAA